MHLNEHNIQSSDNILTDAVLQYLTFRIGAEVYGVGILQAREILQYEDLTTVPSAPASIRGVMNLRGAVVPVIDLAVKFGLAPSEVTKWTCVVIVEANIDGEKTTMGILADAVNEVLDLNINDIESSPAFGATVNTDYLVGMGKTNERFILLLDIDKVLSTPDVVKALSTPDVVKAVRDSIVVEEKSV